MKQRIDLIIFDRDGTLIDSIDWIVHCVQIVAHEHDYPIPSIQFVKDMIGLSLNKAMAQLFPEITPHQSQ